jgi:hypothetical protein
MITVVYPSSSDPLNPLPSQEASAPPTPPSADAYLTSVGNAQTGGLITVVPPSASDNNNPPSGSVPVAPVPVDDATYEKTVNKGKPNGYAALDQTGKVPAAQLPAQSAQGSPVSVSTWDSIQGKPGAFPPVPHAQSHGVGGGDPVIISKSQISDWPATFPPDTSAVQTTSVGVANGVASLGSDGKVPSAQLPAIGSGSGDMLRSTYDTNADGIVDHAALADLASSVSYNNVTNAPGLATTSASGFCPPFDGTSIVLSNGKLTATGGGGGGGSGDMLKSTYDVNNDGIVDHAALADAVPYSGITGKPTLGTSSPLDVASSGDASSDQVVKGNDSRLTNARTPTGHASSHGSAGSDPVTVVRSQISDLSSLSITKSQVSDFPTLGTSSSHDVAPSGNASSSQVVLGNDARLSDSRTPATHASSHASGGSDAVSILKAQVTDLGTIGTAAALNVPSSGNAASGEVVKGSDARLSDSRTPTAHAASHKSGGSDAIKIDELAAGTDVTTLNASTSAHGLLLKLSGTSTQFLNGSGVWSTPAGTGGAGDMSSADYATGTGASNTAHKVDHALYADAAPYSGITGTPTLGTAAAKDIAASGNASSTQVVYGTDTRLTDARTPAAHESTHVTGGSDVIPAATTSASGLVPILPATGATAKFLNGASAFAQVAYADVTGTPTLGTSASHDVAASGNATSTQVVLGNDGRLSDARTPSAHASTHLSGGSDAISNATATVGGLVPAPPNDVNKVYLGNSTWGFLGQQTETNGTFTVPAAGSTVAVTIVSASWPVVGQTVYITDGTRILFGEITVVTSATSVTVKNPGYNGNSVSGTMATASIVKLMAPGVATATQPGFVPVPPNDATKFYSGASTFVAVPYSSLSGTPSSFSPSAHETTHITGGSDVIPAPTTSASGLVPVLPGTGATAKFLNGSAAFAQVAYADVTGTPTLGTAAAKDIPATGNASSTQVVYGSDTRLSDSRTPTAHESTHVTGGSDVIPAPTTSASGLVPLLPATAATTKYLRGDATFTTVDYTDLANLPTLGTAAAKDIPLSGNASSTQVVYGSDTRLADARTPSAHASTHLSGGSDPISAATATASGLVPTPPNNTNKWYRGDSSWTFDAQATETNGTFTVPAAGSTVAVTIVSASWPIVGQTVLITDGTRIGFFEITVVTSATSITVANRGFLGNSTSGTMATGSTVRLVSPGIATATQPGYVPTPPNDATKVLTGAMTYAAVAYANVTGTPTLGTSAAKDIPSSGNASSTQVVYGTDTRLSDSRTPSAHAASHQSGGSDAIALDTLATPTDITTLNATTSAHGLLPKLGGGTTNFFRADGAYAALPVNSTSVTGTVAASPNNTNKVYLGDSSWSFLPQQTETNGTFVVPAAGSTVAVTIVSSAWPVVGQTVWISDGTRVGFFEITVVTSATSLTVKNQGYLGNSTSGTMATGSIVKLVGPNVATSTKPGFVPTPPNDATKFLDGTAAFSTVNYNNLSNLPTLGTSAAKDIPASGNASSTQVVYGSDTRLSDSRTPTAHATSHKSGGSDSIKLDELASTTDVTTLNASTTAHGLLPKLSNVSTQYLDGTGAWSAPAGGGGGGVGNITTTNASFTCPAAGATVSVTFTSTTGFATGMGLYIATAGLFYVSSVTSGTVAVMYNVGVTGNAVSGTIATAQNVWNAGVATPSTATLPGYVPTPPNVASQFLSGLSTWVIPVMKPFKVWVAGIEGIPPSTLYGTFATTNNRPYIAFNDSATWTMLFMTTVPTGASLGGGLIVRIKWLSIAATTGAAVLGVACERMNTNQNADSFDTQVTATTTTSGTVKTLVETAITITTIDGVTAGDGLLLQVQRIGGNGSDTLVGDLCLETVSVETVN